MPLFSIETYGELEPHLRQEWLLTNGLGGFAASSVVGCNTRRYHGLLCAATLPPVGRIMALNRLQEILELDGQAGHPLEFSVNQFRDKSIHPHGERYLRRFQLDDAVARWDYEIDQMRVVKELQLIWRQNVCGVRYTIEADRPDRKLRLSLLPMVSLRDFHAERRGADAGMHVHPAERGAVISEGANSLHLLAETGRFAAAPDWWYGHYYAIEAERGQDDNEDLFTPGRFVVVGTGRLTVTLWASMEAIPSPPKWDEEIARWQSSFAEACALPENLQKAKGRTSIIRETDSVPLRRLARASADFLVYRKLRDGTEGTSVVAGYPWFADWGRDTMISLPGLLLVPGRFRQARQTLAVFADYVSEGMIPNVFDDYSNEPHYNTVDASLWFIHACHEYLRLSGDAETYQRKLAPACRSILDGYRTGTRFHIRMDESDGLITQGDETTQLTWMDAKCGGVTFTPRQGKAVEINALWYHALVLMGETKFAAKVAESFVRTFYVSPFRGLYDVVDGSKRDASIRPNQIFAVSLPNSPLSLEQQAAVVEVVRRELLTPAGLRTLSRSDPRYKGRYVGTQFERDGAYHNGTVWAWLIGAFLEAYLRVNGRSPESVEQAKAWLTPLLKQMETGCIGQIHEIFEGDEPHRPVGCFAQAWSVAEVLRLAVELGM